MSTQERRFGSSCSMGLSCPLLFSIPSILTILSQWQEKAMQNGGRICSFQRPVATRWKQPGQEVSGAFHLLLVANSRLVRSALCFHVLASH